MVLKKIAQARVEQVEQLTGNTFRLTLLEPYVARNSNAGHFVNIQIPNNSDIFWRRPFSVHSTDPDKGTFQILFAAIGRGTASLTLVKPGDILDLIGPLGNSFSIPADANEIIIVAGGLGVAPFKLLLEDLRKIDAKKKLFYGVSAQEHFCCLEEFEALGAQLHLSTDDGSRGYHGLITEPLDEYLRHKENPGALHMFVCGPTPMMARVQELSEIYGVPAQVTVENMMACGFGACVGCPVRLANPPDEGTLYKLACKDGPVFNMDEILFDD